MEQPSQEFMFGSIGRVWVLQSVVEAGEIYIAGLGRRANLNHTSVSKHVEALKELGLIKEELYAGIRMIRPAFDSMTVVLKKERETQIKVNSC